MTRERFFGSSLRRANSARYILPGKTKRYLMLKSRVHWRAGFKPIARGVVDCAGVGVCTSDYGQLDFRNLRRPIFPLDPDARA